MGKRETDCRDLRREEEREKREMGLRRQDFYFLTSGQKKSREVHKYSVFLSYRESWLAKTFSIPNSCSPYTRDIRLPANSPEKQTVTFKETQTVSALIKSKDTKLCLSDKSRDT